MEIFTPEFREELMGNLETITIGLKSDLPINKVKELNDKINLALQKEREIANPKKKKKNQFEVGDVVYWGEMKGIIKEKYNNNSDWSLFVKFENKKIICFTKDGRYYEGMPIVLSHFPYKLKMKKIK
jgi:hypothetical protein